MVRGTNLAYHRYTFRMHRLAVLFALILATLTFAQTQVPQAAKLRAGDEVGVLVTGFDKFNGSYTISDDGMITGIGFGSIEAEGKTIGELKQSILVELR